MELKNTLLQIMALDDELNTLIIDQIRSELQRQQDMQTFTIFGIVAAIVVSVIILLWVFLHPRSPYVKRREDARLRKQKEEDDQKRKEERMKEYVRQKLEELDYTCQHCKAPGLKGPKCEYCQNINFKVD